MNTLDLDIEPDALDLEPTSPAPSPAAEIGVEPNQAGAALVPAAASTLTEVLGADVALPALIKWVPNLQLRDAATKAAAYALGIQVNGPEGLQRADLALAAVRASLKAISDDFTEPTATANKLHKRLTGLRSEWTAEGEAVARTVGTRIHSEQTRLQAIEAEARRKAQEEADRAAREAAKREADAAAAAAAPPVVVEELRRQAATATAPPVPMTTAAAPVLAHSTAVTTWKCRLKGTPGDQEPNPEIVAMTPLQRARLRELLKVLLDEASGVPLQAIEINWSYLNARAKADKGTFDLPGFEAFEVGSTRAKSGRAR